MAFPNPICKMESLVQSWAILDYHGLSFMNQVFSFNQQPIAIERRVKRLFNDCLLIRRQTDLGIVHSLGEINYILLISTFINVCEKRPRLTRWANVGKCLSKSKQAFKYVINFQSTLTEMTSSQFKGLVSRFTSFTTANLRNVFSKVKLDVIFQNIKDLAVSILLIWLSLEKSFFDELLVLDTFCSYIEGYHLSPIFDQVNVNIHIFIKR